MRRSLRLVGLWMMLAGSALAADAGVSQPPEVEPNALPPALRHRGLDRVSSGVAAILAERAGVLRPAQAASALRAETRASHPRVETNTRLGDDPAPLGTQTGQAEPHIIRSPVDPQVLLGTFQEGRRSDGGAFACGYAFSDDGGVTWTRSLTPGLTPVDGSGTYDRATDPVAAYDHLGNAYLNNLVLSEATGTLTGFLVVSRSTDKGRTFGAPVLCASPPADGDFLDKNWIAVNSFAGSPTQGRLLVTFTNFTLSAGEPIQGVLSDDGGATWSDIFPITPESESCQGSFPLFLPDGSVTVVFARFGAGTELVAARSADGNAPYTTPVRIATLTTWDDPDVRDGSFLASAAVDRTTGAIFVACQGRVSNVPRILVWRSTDKGATWSGPTIATDLPGGSLPASWSVFNPGIAVSRGGRYVQVMFYDRRADPTRALKLTDVYYGESYDGGATWQPNLRVTPSSMDFRLSVSTSRGFMLGDYQAMAGSEGPSAPAVPIWIDTRDGNADPYAARIRDVFPSGLVVR